MAELQAQTKKFEKLALSTKVEMLLRGQSPAVVTFYFEPPTSTLVAVKKDSKKLPAKAPTQVITLNDLFLKFPNGKTRPAKSIAADLHDMCHDLGAVKFVV
tara:strand:+ start:11364 stop:11666 length:303 start_codon:yes stop_codon:yes gene_type:complete